jgi:colanic acid biosynthesis glycosyl transferase WcaI
LRLTIVNQFYTPDVSPTAHLASGLAEHRAAMGDDVTVVAGRGGYVHGLGGAGPEVPHGPRVVRVWTPRFGKATLLGRIADYLAFLIGASLAIVRLPGQDAIVAMTTPPYIVAAALLHRRLHRRARVLQWNMDCYPDAAERAGALAAGGPVSRSLRAANRFVFRRLDHLICLDFAMLDLLRSQYAPRDRILPVSVVPNWERASLYPGRERVTEEPPAWFPRDRFVVLYLGNAGTGHDFATVLDAAEALRREPVVFLFVGGGSRFPELRAAVARRRLENVQLEGYVAKERTPALLAASRCGLITLRDEALGVMSPSKLHAQLAMGLPVLYIGPPGSNVDEAVERFGVGASLRHGDTGGVVARLRGWLEDPEVHRALGERARRAFEEEYSDARCLPRFDAILEGTRGPSRS